MIASAAMGYAGAGEDEPYNTGSCIQGHLPRSARRNGHRPRRQLLRLLQEGSEDADQLAANLFGLCEEEHAGGAIAFRDVRARPGIPRRPGRQLEESEIRPMPSVCLGDLMEPQPQGFREGQALLQTFCTSRKMPSSTCWTEPSGGTTRIAMSI